MKTTPTQQRAIETSKKFYGNLNASFQVLGESEFKPGFVVCELKYENGVKRVLMIGKRGNTIWQ